MRLIDAYPMPIQGDDMIATAMVLAAPHTLQARELPLPEIGDDDALLRVEACGLCGTDHEQYSGQLHPGHPFVPGHEAVGVIEEIGPAAERRWGVSRGQRVAVEVFQSCRECDACRSGAYRRCERNGLATMYGFVSVVISAIHIIARAVAEQPPPTASSTMTSMSRTLSASLANSAIGIRSSGNTLCAPTLGGMSIRLICG